MAAGPASLKRRGGLARAIIAVIALYALALQAFLGGMMPAQAAADGLCAEHAGGADASNKALPHGHGDCCTAAQVQGAALQPRPAPEPVTWAATTAAPVAATTLDAPRARAPPGRSTPPRGPPAA